MRKIIFLGLAMLAIGSFSLQNQAVAADAAKGKRVFNKCRACHDVGAKDKVGPHLQGIFGRTAGAVDGFKYSAAMKDSGIVWDETTIAAYMKDPKGYIKGNRMAFNGLRKDADIENLIAYLLEATQ
ncbi:MAG: cytochrome c family protein [Alphaproteobacteria bacterium]